MAITDPQGISMTAQALMGIGGLIVGFVGGWSALFWRTKGMRAELENERQRRRMTNARAAEEADLMQKHADVFVKLKGAGANPAEFREFIEQATLNKRRPRQKKIEPVKVPDLLNLQESVMVEIVRRDGTRESHASPGVNIEESEDGEKLALWIDPTTGQETWDAVPRSADEISEAEAELFDKVWFNRHMLWRAKVEDGEEPTPDPKLWKTATAAAERIKKERDLTGWPWTDFEWGMINGKLSALRWVTGNAWDFLDT